MGAAAAPVISGLGLVTGLIENDKNRQAQNGAINAAQNANMAAINQQQPIFDRLTALHDTILGIVQNAEKSGQFNPDWMIEQLDKDYQRNLGLDMANTAGALGTLGYRPGDSETGVRLDSVMEKSRNDRDRLATDLRRTSFADHMAAYGAIPNNLLGQAAGISSNMASNTAGLNLNLANMYGGRIQSPGGFISSIMPFLNQQNAANPTQSWTSFMGNGVNQAASGTGSSAFGSIGRRI